MNNSEEKQSNDNSGGSERKTWISFEERQEINDIQIQMPSELEEQSSCATIEPTDSIQNK